MRPERLYLNDVVEAAAELSVSMAGRSREDLDSDRMLQAAVLYKMLVIGEATHQVSPQTRAEYPDAPWSALAAFRGQIVPKPPSLFLDVVWITVMVSVPKLRQQAQQALRRGYRDESG